MTIISAILGLLATAMPLILKILEREMSKPIGRIPPVSRLKKLKESRNERILITWAEHDDDVERLLDSMPSFQPTEISTSDS